MRRKLCKWTGEPLERCERCLAEPLLCGRPMLRLDPNPTKTARYPKQHRLAVNGVFQNAMLGKIDGGGSHDLGQPEVGALLAYFIEREVCSLPS